jgi:S1-C subfamily serine protease
LLPFRILFSVGFRILAFVVVASFLGLLVGAAYFGYNYFRPTSQTAIDALAQGTVEVASDTGSGTGAIFKVGNSWEVLTAAHVVGTSTSVVVISRDGSKQKAKVLSAVQEKDIAILAVSPGRGWTAMTVNRSKPLPGNKVATLCYFDQSTRQGLVAGPVDDSRIGDLHMAQLDVGAFLSASGSNGILALIPSQPGCSGAPLVDQSGHIVGIVVAGDQVSTIAVSAATALP